MVQKDTVRYNNDASILITVLLDLKAIVAMSHRRQQLLSQLRAARVRRKVDLVRAGVHRRKVDVRRALASTINQLPALPAKQRLKIMAATAGGGGNGGGGEERSEERGKVAPAKGGGGKSKGYKAVTEEPCEECGAGWIKQSKERSDSTCIHDAGSMIGGVAREVG